MYYERVTKKRGGEAWADKKEYDGIILVKDATGIYRPVVLELKVRLPTWSRRGFNESMRPGEVEKKLKPLKPFFGDMLGYGVIGLPEK